MQSNQCNKCKHYTGLIQCEAYPEKIPTPIVTGQADHSKPYAGDHGIRWEPIPNADGQ